MNQPSIVLLVRFKSELSLEELLSIAEERAPQFQALGGILQKYYLQDAATDEYAGLYLWNSQDELSEFQQSKLRASIAAAYKAIGQPRIEVYKVEKVLRDELGFD